ncbi:MAG TPA: hypothetical protein VE010_17260 [Thermoanaerobaculia bacterium]|nr:hypothetical protein [Thermoanaerobaculia bacterium]
MSKSASMSAYEIRLEGWKALTERLGPAGAMRFMMQYDPGHGDYTNERQKIFADLDLDELLASVAQESRSGGDGE